MREKFCILLAALGAFAAGCSHAPASSQEGMDRDLMEVTIPRLEQFYSDHKYTVTQVVEWHLARVNKYNGIYRAIEKVDTDGALDIARREDAEAGGANSTRGPLWGVPIVIKENTSVQGLVTSDGWKGYTIPGHELVAPKDAPIVAKLRAAGVNATTVLETPPRPPLSDPLEVACSLDQQEPYDKDEDEGFGRRLILGRDDELKAGISGLTDLYGIPLPSSGADAQFEDWHKTSFVNYLRIAFEWGGFPGWERYSQRPEKEIAYLREGLLPF